MKHGIGTAYIAGFKYVIQQGDDVVFEIDADFSHDPRYPRNLYSPKNVLSSSSKDYCNYQSMLALPLNAIFPRNPIIAFLGRILDVRQTY